MHAKLFSRSSFYIWFTTLKWLRNLRNALVKLNFLPLSGHEMKKLIHFTYMCSHRSDSARIEGTWNGHWISRNTLFHQTRMLFLNHKSTVLYFPLIADFFWDTISSHWGMWTFMAYPSKMFLDQIFVQCEFPFYPSRSFFRQFEWVSHECVLLQFNRDLSEAQDSPAWVPHSKAHLCTNFKV